MAIKFRMVSTTESSGGGNGPRETQGSPSKALRDIATPSFKESMKYPPSKNTPIFPLAKAIKLGKKKDKNKNCKL